MTIKNWIVDRVKEIAIGRVPELVENESWQNQVTQRFTLEHLDGRFTLFDGELEVLSFHWDGIVEVQYLSRESFPPVMWKIVSNRENWFVPGGGGYVKALTDVIHALPGYYQQQAIAVVPDAGFNHATSLWRKYDPFPPRNEADFEDLDF